MARRCQEGILPFKIVATDEPLVARGGLVLPYELAKALKLPKVIDRELPSPGSGRGVMIMQPGLTYILLFWKVQQQLLPLRGHGRGQ